MGSASVYGGKTRSAPLARLKRLVATIFRPWHGVCSQEGIVGRDPGESRESPGANHLRGGATHVLVPIQGYLK